LFVIPRVFAVLMESIYSAFSTVGRAINFISLHHWPAPVLRWLRTAKYACCALFVCYVSWPGRYSWRQVCFIL